MLSIPRSDFHASLDNTSQGRRGCVYSTAASGNCYPVRQKNGISEPAEGTVLSPVAQPGWRATLVAVRDQTSLSRPMGSSTGVWKRNKIPMPGSLGFLDVGIAVGAAKSRFLQPGLLLWGSQPGSGGDGTERCLRVCALRFSV